MNAPEKRRAIAGNMRKIVSQLSKHEFFKLSGFKDKRYSYEDVVAKLLHMLIHGTVTNITPTAIKSTYEKNKTISIEHPAVKNLRNAFDLICQAFSKTSNPNFKKHSMITLVFLIAELQKDYDLDSFKDKIGEQFLEFEEARFDNEKIEDENDKDDAASLGNIQMSQVQGSQINRML